MRGTQAILSGLVLAGGVGMLITMIGWVDQQVGLISAGVVIAAFGFMAYGDMRAMNKSRAGEDNGGR